MKLKNILNPFGITREDFKDPAFQEGMASVAFYFGVAALIGWVTALVV